MPESQRSCTSGHVENCNGLPIGCRSHLTLEGPAKLNIFLEVLGRRPDGFHDLETVMLRTQFCDQLTFHPTQSPEITLRFSDATPSVMRAGVPLDETNLILKAARRLQQHSGTSLGARIVLNKKIPPESGLGGGSSNAATTLLGCRQLWNIDTSDSQLHSIASTLGSDINFLLSGSRAAVCRGRGEIIEPIAVKRRMYFVAMRPRTGNSTPVVFRNTRIPENPQRSAAIADFVTHGIGDLNRLIFNRLTAAAMQLNPEMTELLKRVPQTLQRPAFMSGSGSTVYVVARSHSDAVSASEIVKARFHIRPWILECG